MSLTAKKLGLFIVCLTVLPYVTGYSMNDVKNLKKFLFEDSGYDTSVRPQFNQSKPTDIEITLSATSILDFDMASGRISMAGYLYAFWYDEQLLWDPAHFNGITNIQVNRESVWHPNLRNAFDLQNTFSVSHLSVYFNGRVIWIPTNIFEAVCSVDITYYPFDEHECGFPVFPSSGSFIRFISMQDTVHIHTFQTHGEWEIISTQAEVMELQDPQYMMKTSTFVSIVRLWRRPRFALLHTYFPLLLMYCLNLLSCLVPLGQGERVSFSVTVLLALIFFTASVTASFPQSSLTTSYFSATMTLAICASTLGVMFSVVLVKLDVTTSPVPRPLCFIVKRSTKGRKNSGMLRHRNSIMSITESDLDGEMNKSEHENGPGDDATDTVRWADISEKLNMVVFCLYSLLLVISVVVLIILHHHR